MDGSQFIAHGFDSLNNSIAQAFDYRERQKEQMKREAQLTQSLRKTLDLTDPEGKDMRARVGLPDLQAELRARELKSADLERAQREAQVAQLRAGPRFAAEMAQFGPAEQQPSVLSPEELARRSAPVGMPQIAGAAGRAGYSMRPDDMAQLAVAMEKMGRPRFTPGTVQSVPDLPGYMYGVQNAEGAGSFLPVKGLKGPVDFGALPAIPGYLPAPDGKGGIHWVKLDVQGLANQNVAEATMEKTLAQLRNMKQRGVKEATVGPAGAAEGGWFSGKKNIDDLIAGTEAELKTLRSKGAAGASAAGGGGKSTTENTEGTEAPGGAATGKTPKPAGMSDAQIIAEARRAIAQGKDPEGVKAKLKAWGLELK